MAAAIYGYRCQLIRFGVLPVALAVASASAPLPAQEPTACTVLALRKPPDDGTRAALSAESAPFDRPATSDSSRGLRDDLRTRYRARRPDVVIASSSTVRDFVLNHYRWVILFTLILLALQTAMIVGFVVQRARRREMAAALYRTQARYSLASAAGRVGVWDWDPETDSLFVDPSVREFLGYADNSAAQQLADWLQLVRPEDRALVTDRLREHLEGRSPGVEFEHRMRHGDGTVRWVHIRGAAASDAGGPVRIVGTITDITDRKHAERQLEETQHELSRVARVTALGEFAASIAHEVRQPLTAIISSARAAARFLDAGATADAKEALGYVLEAGRQADRVIERNRELFRRCAVQKEFLDWNSVVTESARMARSRLESGGVSLVTALAPDLPRIEGDRVELRQVLLNLIVNAVDAMETLDPAARRLEISTAFAPPDAVRISVRDNGVGLAQVDLRRLFTFSYTTKPGGSGVGLSISRSIIEAHGGRLWADQNANGGATFSFTLPVAAMREARAAVAR